MAQKMKSGFMILSYDLVAYWFQYVSAYYMMIFITKSVEILFRIRHPFATVGAQGM